MVILTNLYNQRTRTDLARSFFLIKKNVSMYIYFPFLIPTNFIKQKKENIRPDPHVLIHLNFILSDYIC
jgi:hypothetical protein